MAIERYLTLRLDEIKNIVYECRACGSRHIVRAAGMQTRLPDYCHGCGRKYEQWKCDMALIEAVSRVLKQDGNPGFDILVQADTE